MNIHRSAITAAVVAACAVMAGTASGNSHATAAGKKLTIGAVLQTGASPGQQEFLGGLKAQAKKYGYSVKVVDAQADAAKGNDLIQSLVDQKVDAISVQVLDPVALNAGLAAAAAAHIPVYLYYAYGKPKNVAAVITVLAAKRQTERMVRDMGGKGSVLAFTFRIGQPCVYGEKEFDAVLKAYPAISVRKQEVAAPGWQKDGSVATASWLQSHPAGKEPLAIWGCWDGPAEGAASALREAGRTDVKVYGDFAEPAGLDALKKGLFTATYWFDNRASGRKTIDLIRADSTKKVIVPTYINAPAVEVDQSNINQFLKKYPQALKG